MVRLQCFGVLPVQVGGYARVHRPALRAKRERGLAYGNCVRAREEVSSANVCSIGRRPRRSRITSTPSSSVAASSTRTRSGITAENARSSAISTSWRPTELWMPSSLSTTCHRLDGEVRDAGSDSEEARLRSTIPRIGDIISLALAAFLCRPPTRSREERWDWADGRTEGERARAPSMGAYAL